MTSFVDQMHTILPHADTADPSDLGVDFGGDLSLFSGIDDSIDFDLQNTQSAFLRRIRSPEQDVISPAPELDLKSDSLLFSKSTPTLSDAWLEPPTLSDPISALESNSSASSVASAGTAAQSTGQRQLDGSDSAPHASPNTPMLINSSPDLGPAPPHVSGSPDELQNTPPRSASTDALSSSPRDFMPMNPSLPLGMVPIQERAFALHRMSMPALSLNMSQLTTPTPPTRTESIDLGNPELGLSRMRLNSLSSPQSTSSPLGTSLQECSQSMRQNMVEPLRNPHVLRNSTSTFNFGRPHETSTIGMQAQPYPLFIDPLSTNALALAGTQSPAPAPSTPQTPRGTISPVRRGRPPSSARTPRKAQSTPHFEFNNHVEHSPGKPRKGLRKIASNRRMAATYVNQSPAAETSKRPGRLQARGSMAALRQASSLQASLRQPPMQQRRPMTLSFVNYGIADAEELCAAVAPSGSYKVPLRGHDERESSDQDELAQRSDS